MNNIINERVKALRKVMKEKGIDVYYIPTSDFHDSEYVSSYFRGRAWMSGFTGSAGVMAVSQEKAVVWSDGRYFIQAERQLSNTCIDFYRMGEKGYPTTLEFIANELPDHGVLGFDGKVVSAVFGENLERAINKKHGTIHYEEDLLNEIWKDRPTLPTDEIFELKEEYAGKSFKEKVNDVRNVMKQFHATKHILTTLDDIAWLLNIRGNDVACNPVVLSYVVVSESDVIFYLDQKKINTEVANYFNENHIIVKDYESIYEDVKQYGSEEVVLLDKERCNYTIVKSMSDEVKTVIRSNPTTMMKAIKNEVEIQNLRKSHIKDGVAVTKFMYWLKTNVGKIAMDEVSVAEKLTSLRAQQEHFLDISFTTIAGYNENAAMMHYSANEENKAELKPEGLLLVDSGGQYLEGTTDITRTFGLGVVPEEWKRDFTLVLKGMIQLSRGRFLEGCSGINLDILARQPLWERYIDYQCGTGHGVGYLLNVHEGPQGFRWKKAFNRKEDTPLAAGMVITNEPGIYVEGSHGIRCENEMIVRKDKENQYGQFMDFETITFAPFDLDLIDVNYLDEDCRNWLNAYHKEVYEKLSPALNEAEKTWLKQYTRAI